MTKMVRKVLVALSPFIVGALAGVFLRYGWTPPMTAWLHTLQYFPIYVAATGIIFVVQTFRQRQKRKLNESAEFVAKS